MARYASRNNEPLARWHDHPVYLTTILTALFAAGHLLTAILQALRSPLLEMLSMQMPLHPAWSLWRLGTYIFADRISFFTPFAILFFYWMSLGIETHIGRVLLAKLLVLLALVTPAVLAFFWWGRGLPSIFAGNYVFLSGLLVAFATLYPNSEAWGWVPFKWMAFACVLCGSMLLFGEHDWLQLTALWTSCAVGFAYMRHAKELEYDDYESPLAGVAKFFQRKPKLRVLPAPAPRAPRHREIEKDDAMSEVDALLDKIAQSGMASLTPRERAKLEEARAALMKKDGN